MISENQSKTKSQEEENMKIFFDDGSTFVIAKHQSGAFPLCFFGTKGDEGTVSVQCSFREATKFNTYEEAELEFQKNLDKLEGCSIEQAKITTIVKFKGEI